MLTAVSPIDGRYESKTESLKPYFSEFALIKYRLKVEALYLKALQETEIKQLGGISDEIFDALLDHIEHLKPEDAQKVKDIEKVTNHDVKAVEYYLKDFLKSKGVYDQLENVHFGLTSQDINNTSFPLMVKDALENTYVPLLQKVMDALNARIKEWEGIPMLARTHGQPASPTTLGKEFEVFTERIKNQLERLKSVVIYAKFGGATGNFNAHLVSYPDYNWVNFGNQFVSKKLGLSRHQKTTQIAHYDDLADVFQTISRINTILIDLARDVWTYISMDYFKQKVVKGEVGSSAMPHKVNPIDFENAEGNFGVANAIFQHLAEKLPISRLQRDLTDSTVLRNVGVPFGHTLIGFQSILKGLTKLELNESKLSEDLDKNWAVVAEAIQNILRREKVEKPYEKLKALTRGSAITKDKIHDFIETLPVSDDVKKEMLVITPHNYIGYF